MKFLFVGIFIFSLGVLKAQETKFVALYLYNFTKYIDWPEEHKKGDFVIGVVGNNQVYSELVQIAEGKLVGNQTIVVKNFRSIEEVTGCHILYLSENQSRRVDQALSRIKGQSAPLVVTQQEGATLLGAAINFVIRNETMKFELKKDNATKFGLKLHSRLDNLAIII